MDLEKVMVEEGEVSVPLILNSCCKNLLGMLFKNCSFSARKEIREALRACGIALPKQTISTWKRNHEKHGSAISPVKSSGAKQVVSPTVETLAVGYITDTIEQEKPTSIKDVHDWLRLEAKVDCSYSTARRLVEKNGFTVQKVRRKGGRQQGLADSRAQRYYEFVSGVAGEVFKIFPASQIASIDFTYTSHRSHVLKGLGFKGG